MLKEFEIKSGLVNNAILDMLGQIYAQQLGTEKLLIDDFCERENHNREEFQKVFDAQVARFREQIMHYLYEQYGNLDVDEINL